MTAGKDGIKLFLFENLKTDLSPKHIAKLDNNSILWFEPSNQYIVISDALWAIVARYLDCPTQKHFVSQLQSTYNISLKKAEVYYNEITELLISSNQKQEIELNNPKSLLMSNQAIVEVYRFGNTTIKISFGSEKIRERIHPQWAHLATIQSGSITFHFHLYNDLNHIYLFKNELYIADYPLTDYHLLQGQFALQIINSLYNKTESDWIATFHASTVCNDKEAIMIIGDSGNGKSTLAAVLMANGLDVLADDFSPLSAENQELYRFPSGISVKEGAFSTLKPMFQDFEQFPIYTSTSKNVKLKYIPPMADFGKAASHFPCQKIVMVNYDANAKSEMKTIRIEKVLETLIPESWLSPLASNSRLFLDWLKEVSCYELTYSDNSIAVSQFKKLFDS